MKSGQDTSEVVEGKKNRHAKITGDDTESMR
jgi:hypothetical protein